MIVLEEYVIERRVMQSGEISFDLVPNDNQKISALDCPNRLLYVIKNGNEFLYVGEAKSNLKNRITRGFIAYRFWKRNGQARKGYKGYKWIELFDQEESSKTLKQLRLTCFIFDESRNDKREFIEAIEGELVLLIRNHTGQWPLFQNEIHFNNENPESIKIAKDMFQKLK
jgi:hypothetical protein